jgi:RNA polymerase sigma factor (sigma-70 family)
MGSVHWLPANIRTTIPIAASQSPVRLNIQVPESSGNHSCTEMAGNKHTLVERLFAEHGGALRSFLSRRVRKLPDAAELAQEVYLRMLRLEDSSVIENPEAYLYTVASNLAKEHSRLESRRAGALDIDDPVVQQQLAVLPSFGTELDDQQQAKRLQQVLRQLPVKCHAVVMLQYWHGLSYEEIAQRLGISTHMVKKYLSQAMVHCRKRMARQG